MNYEERKYNEYKSKVKTENPQWASRGATDQFWKHKTGYCDQPPTGSQQEQYVTRHGLKGEVFNKYKAPTPDPFKAVYVPKPKKAIEDIPGNVAKIEPYPKKDLVANLKGIRSKETNFTDYQLYFKDCLLYTSPSPRDS